jgi:twitching motility protein PilI
MARRTSLREFQRKLSERIEQAAVNPRGASFLAVKAGDQGYIVNLAEIVEVVAVPLMAEVPLVKPWFRGVAAIRGTLYGVSDLSGLRGGDPIRLVATARLLIIRPEIVSNAAILVSATVGLRPVAGLTEMTSTPGAGFLDARYSDQAGGIWTRLSLASLASSPDFLEIGG